MYTSIDIDFDVFKELTMRRKDPETTYNDVVRELLDLPPVENRETNSEPRNGTGAPWVWKGITLPHGTDLRARHGGKAVHARIENGAILYNGQLHKAPSSAARAVTGTSVNGWVFWECRLPGDTTWKLMSDLR